MNTETTSSSSTLVWDLPVRLFHWLLVACFAGAWLTSDSEHWRLAHVWFGYGMAGLVGLRLVWGLVGTQHARFASFVRGPRAALAYLRSLLGPRPQHYLGHNPAGGLAIVGDVIFAGSVGRTDFSHHGKPYGDFDTLAHSIRHKLYPLGDAVE